MLLIACPYCGPRDETEFHYGGQAHVAYPVQPDQLTDAEWAQYLFYRDNPKGLFAERWLHRTGCRQWFNAIRDTVTYEITTVYRIGECRPIVALPCGEQAGTANTRPDTVTTGRVEPDTLSSSVIQRHMQAEVNE